MNTDCILEEIYIGKIISSPTKCLPPDMKAHILDQIHRHVFDPKFVLLFVKRNVCTKSFWIEYNYTSL